MTASSQTAETAFAHEAMRDAALYTSLAQRERTRALRDALNALADIAQERAQFWCTKSDIALQQRALSSSTLLWYRVLRAVLGVTLTAKYILGHKEARVAHYKEYCATCTVDEDYRSIEDFAERMHGVVADIEEARVAFFSNIVLGFNDALIELTGALVGFLFALRDPALVAVAGLVTGVSASLSMAASAYQQARHETGRSPLMAALYTGVSYFAIAMVLVAPFVLIADQVIALVTMSILVCLMLMVISFYSAILLDRRYLSQLGEMSVFSVGVAIVAFLIGHAFNTIIGS